MCCNWSLNRFPLPPLSVQLIGVYAAFQPAYTEGTWLKGATSSLSLFFIESALASIAVRHLLLRLGCLPTLISILEQLYQGRWYIFTLFLTRYIAREVRSYRRLSYIKGPRLAQFSELWLLATIFQQRAHYVFYDDKKEYEVCSPLIYQEPKKLTAGTDWDQHVDHL
jgi:hypothetical protein